MTETLDPLVRQIRALLADPGIQLEYGGDLLKEAAEALERAGQREVLLFELVGTCSHALPHKRGNVLVTRCCHPTTHYTTEPARGWCSEHAPMEAKPLLATMPVRRGRGRPRNNYEGTVVGVVMVTKEEIAEVEATCQKCGHVERFTRVYWARRLAHKQRHQKIVKCFGCGET